MSHYRKIDTRIWNDEKFNSFSDKAKLLFLFLLTHPHLTPLGAMRMSLEGLAGELHWSIPTLKKAFDEIILKKMLMFCCKSSFLWVPNFIKYNKPSNQKMIQGWGKFLENLPECELKRELIQHVSDFITANCSAEVSAALPIPFRYGMAYGIGYPSDTREERREKSNNISINTGAEIEIVENEKEKIFIEMPTKLGNNFPVFEAIVQQYKKNYPSVDVETELKIMREWLENKSRPKGYQQMPQFITNWLQKNQHECDNVLKLEKQGVKQHAKNNLTYTKQPTAFEQAMSPGVQWAAD